MPETPLSSVMVLAVAGAVSRAGFFGSVHAEVMRSKAGKCLGNLGNAFDAITDGRGDGRTFMDQTRREAMEIWDAAGIAYESRDEFMRRVRPHYGERKIPVGYEEMEKHRGENSAEMSQLIRDFVAQLEGRHAVGV